jgi:polar amino acid transport system substrate-binding protein
MVVARPLKALILGTLLLASAAGATRAAAVAAPDRIAKAGKIVFCTDIGFPPWELIDPASQQPVGFDIDMAAALAKTMGVTSEHKNISFDGLIPALQAGQCDAIISGLYDKPERRRIVDFVHYAVTGDSLIVKATSNLQVTALTDMSGKKVALGIGTAGEGEINAANDQLKATGKPEIIAVPMQTSAEAFQQLSAGLVEAYLGSTDQAGYYNKQRPGMVKLAGPVLFTLPIGVATLHKDKDLHDAFAAALAQLKSNGEYAHILQTWGFTELAVH